MVTLDPQILLDPLLMLDPQLKMRCLPALAAFANGLDVGQAAGLSWLPSLVPEVLASRWAKHAAFEA